MSTSAIDIRKLEGTQVKDYVLEKKLGSGAFGTVYRAIHPNLKRHVALKCLLLNDKDAASRVDHEIKILIRLEHPHIVQILDHFPVGDLSVHLIMMQYLAGGTVRGFLSSASNRRLDPPTVALLLGQLSRALDYLHDKDVLHLDIKPDNILLDGVAGENTNFFLADFGVSRLREEDHIKGAGGTPYYMAPEQFQARQRNSSSELSSATDVYELGIVLYELLTGVRPFQKATYTDIAYQHLIEPPIPPRRLASELPSALDEVILKALAKKPEDRYARAGDLSRDFLSAVGSVTSSHTYSERLLGEFARQQAARSQQEIPTVTALSLKVIGPDGTEREHQFTGTSIVAGNREGVDLKLDDPALAGTSFRIDWTPGGRVSVTDLGGKSSVFLGGSKALADGGSAEWNARQPLMVSRYLLKSALTDVTMTAPPLNLSAFTQAQAQSLPPRIRARVSRELIEARIGTAERIMVKVMPENAPFSVYKIFVRELSNGFNLDWLIFSDPKPIRAGEEVTFEGMLSVNQIRAGNYQLLLGVSAEDPSIPELPLVLKVRVKPEPGFKVALSPDQVVHRRLRRATVQLHVNNTGNFDEDYEITTTAHQFLEVEADRTVVSIPMGQHQSIPVRVQPKRGTGKIRHMWFKVHARGIQGRQAGQEAQGSYSLPLVRRMLTPYNLLLGLIVLAIAIYVGYRLMNGATLAEIWGEFVAGAQQLRKMVEGWLSGMGGTAS